MAFVLTYNTLTEAIIDYLERTDDRLVESIPLFIMLGQKRLTRDLKILGIKNSVTDNLISNNGLLQKPTGWVTDASFNISTGPALRERIYLLQRSTEFCRMYWPDPTKVGTPKYYSNDYNYNYWFIVPTPDIAYPYEILYYSFPPPIDETTSTNFFTENIPNVILYATLLETASYLKDDDRIGVWTKYYDDARAAISEEEMKRIYDAFSKRGG